MEQIKWIFENMKGHRRTYIFAVFLHLFVYLPLLIFTPVLLSNIIDTVFADNRVVEAQVGAAIKMLVIYLVLCIIRSVVNYTYFFLEDCCAAHTLASFRSKLYKKLQMLSQTFYSNTRTGDIMMRLTGDLEIMRHFTAWVMSNSIHALILLFGGFSVFFYTNWKLALVLLVTVPVVGFVVVKFRKTSAEKFRIWREAGSRLNAYVQENIAANRVVKAFAREDFEQERFEKYNEDYRKTGTDASTVWAYFAPVLNAVSNFTMVAIIAVGGIMVINGSLTVGELYLFYSLNWLIADSMNLLGTVMNDAQKFFSSTQKVMQLNYARVDIKSVEGAKTERGCGGSSVEFKNVTYKYNSKTKALDSLSFKAEPGQTIGIMGPTGSGKTTLAFMMGRFLDASEGEVLIDGVNVKEYDLHDLRGRVSYAMQDVFLFSNTVDSNIAYSNPDMPFEEVQSYAVMADADSFIKKMPDGYDTVVGERGVGLSGGQKQRIALARALADDAGILVLDDTTSAVDMETEKYIQSQLAQRKRKQTTFIIAQRISSVKDADKIIILDKGKIIEEGTHRVLLDKKGYYYDIYRIQQGMGEESEVSGRG